MLRSTSLGLCWLVMLSCGALLSCSAPAAPEPDDKPAENESTEAVRKSSDPLCTACPADEDGYVALDCYCEKINSDCPSSIAEAMDTKSHDVVEIKTCAGRTFVNRENIFDAQFFGFVDGTLTSAGAWREDHRDCPVFLTAQFPEEGCDEPCVVVYGTLTAAEGTCLTQEEIDTEIEESTLVK